MTTHSSGSYLVRHIDEAPTVVCPCGLSTRALTGADQTVCNLHVTFIKDSVRHYHCACTEVYYILEGQGKMELNGAWVDVRPGSILYIEPYTRHRLVSTEGVRTVIVGVPAFDPADEFFD